MELVSKPATLTCAVCDTDIEGAGYLPASETGDGYDPHPDDAVCDACGFNEIGMMGCAPELSDVVDAGSADALLYVTMDGSLDVVSAK